MGKREKRDGDAPFGSALADWAIPGVDREPVEPAQQAESLLAAEPVAASTVTPPSTAPAQPRRRLILPPSDDLPEVAPGSEGPDVLAGLELIRQGMALVQGGSMAGSRRRRSGRSWRRWHGRRPVWTRRT